MLTDEDQLFAETRNRESALELGWTPAWFGLEEDDFSSVLTEAVEAFQASSLGPVADETDFIGVVGWATFLRLHELLEAEAADDDPAMPEEEAAAGLLLINGEALPVPFAVRQLPIDQTYYRCPTQVDGVRCNPRRYSSAGRCSGCGAKRKKGYRYRTRKGPPKRAIWHWPVTETTRNTHRFLSAKGISSNGEVSFDGTFTQFCDLKYRTFHAGSKINNAGVGFDVSLNPVRKQKIEARQRKIESWGREPRPVIEGVSVRGWKPGPFLYYYDRQLVTVAGLRAALHVYLDLPLESPRDAGPKTFQAAASQSFVKKASGHFGHSDVTNRKWDACISDETPIKSAGCTVIELARQLAEGMTR